MRIRRQPHNFEFCQQQIITMAVAIKYYDVPLGIFLKQRFVSIPEIEQTVEAASKQNFVQMYKRDSRTIQAAQRKVKRYLNPELEFYSVQYNCIHGGQTYICRGRGKRNKKTFRKNDLCPAHILFRLSENGNDFEVVKINNLHNHLVSEELYKRLVHNRKLPDAFKRRALNLLKLRDHKRLKELEAKSKECITLRDLSNFKRSDYTKYSNSIEAACYQINSKFGSDCELLMNSENTLMGLMFCTRTMQIAMSAYPELLCIDATSNLLEIGCPVYVTLIEDGNGESQIVSVAILVREDKESLQLFLESFKNLNSSWTKINNIMADKELNEQDLLKECFPDVQLYIYIFHVFKVFQREVTCGNLKITPSERSMALRLLQELLYCRNDIEFKQIKRQMENKLSDDVIHYLKDNWINIKQEWCPKLGQKIFNFLKTTNNHLEGLNSKLKSVIKKHSTLEEFMEKLLTVLESLEIEKDSRVAYMVNKESTNRYKPSQIEYAYEKILTDYGFQQILHQIQNSYKIKYETDNDTDFLIKYKDSDQYNATHSTCSCYFFNLMQLPCKHIFKVRAYLKMEGFDPDLVHTRWTKEYFLSHQRLLLPKEENNEDSENIDSKASVSKVTITQNQTLNTSIETQHEKYKMLLMRCKIISALMSEACGDTFEQYLNYLDNVIEKLNNNDFEFFTNSEGSSND